jgi:hypothetical protein
LLVYRKQGKNVLVHRVLYNLLQLAQLTSTKCGEETGTGFGSTLWRRYESAYRNKRMRNVTPNTKYPRRIK